MTQRINLDKVEQLTVTRSFSRKVQMDQYEPIESFASAQAILKPDATEADLNKASIELNDFAVREVERAIDEYIRRTKPPF